MTLILILAQYAVQSTLTVATGAAVIHLGHKFYKWLTA